MANGYLVLESGEIYQGDWLGGEPRAGEVVFNTSHSGYEEMATDPSYFNQILITTASMQGNYGISESACESGKLQINGFICLEMQKSAERKTWLNRLTESKIPVMDGLDTRAIVLHLREQGTTWGALVSASTPEEATRRAQGLIQEKKSEDRDWPYQVSTKEMYVETGARPEGPRVAVVDFGCKANIRRELIKRCREVAVFPTRSSAEEIRNWDPDGILLSNGPGDPENVQGAAETVRELMGWRSMFGICMGHQILGRALGAETFPLKFGHRGGNHPIKDKLLNKIYVTSQNHGYAVSEESLPEWVEVTHTNLNDGTVAGIRCLEKKCMSVQFHPESRPGPHDAETLFDEFIKSIQ